MCNWSTKIGWVLATLAFSHATHAGFSVLAGRFDGSEPASVVIWPDFDQSLSFPSRQIQFTVSITGAYRMEDVYEHWYFGPEGRPAIHLLTGLYRGGYNPQQPSVNRLGSNDEASSWAVPLVAGVQYTLVLQNVSERASGLWTLAIRGPGEVHSAAAVSMPSLAQGKFTGNEAKRDNLCVSVPAMYRVDGPFRVSRAGAYYITNLSHMYVANQGFGGSGICYGVYSGLPNLDNPGINRLAFMDHYRSAVSLEPGTDYYLLVQATENRADSYTFLIAPPAAMEITPFMSGLWADPATDGQGLMLNVYPSIDAMHLAWFTYDLELPSSQATAQIGDAGHRWLTAFGELEGSGSNMTITRTQGGIFDSAQPVPAQIQDGTIQLHFDSCTSGTLTYDLGSTHATGQLNLRRPFEDAANIDRCVLANMGPGIPGPL